jgi:hypothetical protein
LVPFGPYNVTMTTIPAGYNVLGNSTIYTVDNTNLNGNSVFRLTPVNYNLTTLPSTVITSSPNLNGSTLSNWMSSFNAHQHNGTQPVTQINAVMQLPPIISAGISNPSAITMSIANQATVQLDTNFAPQTDPATIIKDLGVPTYSVPKTSYVVSIIPSIVAQSSDLNVPTQTVTTPPLDKIVPGQRMILPVNSGTIPNTGGLKQMDITSSSSASSSTGAPSDWFVVKVDNTIPNNLPSFASSGIKDKPTLYVNVTYQHEVNNQGFDWSNPNNFAHPPRLTLQLPKPSASSGIKTDSNGCPISDIFLYDPTTKTWTTNTVTIISLNPTAGNPSTCDVLVQAMHFSGFGLGSPGTSGTGTGTGTGTGNGVGAGGVGTGPGTSSTSTSMGLGGSLAPYIKIAKISYDTCVTKKVTIELDTDSNSTGIHVILRTSLTGVVDAQLAKDQPFAEENVNATIHKFIYEAPLDPNEKSFEVLALVEVGNNVFSEGQTVEVNGCNQTIDFTANQLGPSIPIDLSAPKIFDVKFMVGNSTKVSLSEITNQFVKGQSLTVSAIISSPTPLNHGELRYMTAGQSQDNYAAVAMNVSPLPISNSTYIITGTIPAQDLQAPAVQYWIHVENHAGKTSDSDRYSIGVKPNYPIIGNLELDVTQNRAAGTIARPTAYFNASGNPVFGTVSLVVDGNTVYTSPPQLFTSGQTAVSLEWKTQPTDQLANHQIQAIANIYDNTFTAKASITTFSSVKTMSILQPIQIDTITDNSGHTIANPVVLYSSFKNAGTMIFKVTAPDGTCVIGNTNDCLVTSSTFGLPGQLKSIVIGDQVYRVRYSGTDSPLERFSITSIDPIVGKWNVEIDSTTDLLPQAQAMGDVFLKVKYEAERIPFMPQGN